MPEHQHFKGQRNRRREMVAMLDLLNDQWFCEDVRALYRDASALLAAGADDEQGLAFLSGQARQFIGKWKVLPPQAPELIAPDPRRRIVEAVMSGRWGLLPVFPWTTDAEIGALVKTIRKALPRRHQDADKAQRNAQIAEWLEANEFSRPEIASLVWQRRRGLRRPTRNAAIRRITEEEEETLLKKYMGQGLNRSAAQSRLYRRKRGTEPPASAAVRMAGNRYETYLERLNADLKSPVSVDPIGFSVTQALQALLGQEEDMGIVRKAIFALRDALIR